MISKKPLGIYLHIPFCVRKCNYCDFLSAPADEEVRRRYVESLLEEIQQFSEADQYEVRSVFFGGGTPSLLEGEMIERLMGALRRKFSFSWNSQEKEDAAECTIECNPGTLTSEKLRAYRDCGINRLSLGLQSAEDEELKILGRIHTWKDCCRNYELTRKLGFDNVNVDLMSALPGQTVESWQRTVKQVLAYGPEHISAYSLIIEEGTPFYEDYGAQARDRAMGREVTRLPSEEEDREMYYDTERILTAAKMHRYEISNYAKPGFESVHNSGYWLRREYAGFGLGASSQTGKLRYKNTDCLAEYLRGDYSRREVQELSQRDEIEETMFLGLRMTQGVNLKKFADTFGVSAEQIYKKELEKLECQSLIRREGGFLKLTARGIDVSNAVLAEFLLD